MSGLAGQSIGLEGQSPTPIGGDAAVDAESRGSMENFIGFGLGATSYDPDPVDFDAADDTVTSASDGSTRVAPEYVGNQLMWGENIPTFIPSDLFAPNDEGFWLDFGDLSTMFQDQAGEIPVTAVGQPVGLVIDKSGRGNDCTFTSVTLEVVDGIYGLKYVAGGASKGVTPSVDLASDKIISAASLMVATGITPGTVVSNGAFISVPQTFDIGSATTYRRGSGAWGARAIALKYDEPCVETVVLDIAGTTQDTENPVFTIDQVQGTFTNYGSADTGSGDFQTSPLTVGSGYAGFVGTMFQAFLINRVLTQDELDALDYYLLDHINKLPLVPYTGELVWHDSEALIDKGDYQQTSAYAFVEFQTTATRIGVVGYTNIYNAFPTYATLGIFVDGAFYTSVASSSMGAF